MSTPIRQLICRNLSPKKLSPTNCKICLNHFSPNKDNKSLCTRTFAQSLKCTTSPKKFNLDIHHGENSHFIKTPVTKISDFRIVISSSECTDEDTSVDFDVEKEVCKKCDYVLPFFNTPNRKEILKQGLNTKTSWNVLGKGSYGTVIQAIYKDKKVAVKIVPNNMKTNLLDREMNSVKLNHESIVKTIKVVCEPLQNYGAVLMEDCSDYENMQTILEDGFTHLTMKIITEWLSDVCLALMYCHQEGVVHLDIKPKNILVQLGKKCKICDFGNSLNIFLQSQDHYVHQGTVAYTAPEIFRGQNIDFSADVYSLGITMWQIQSRVMPYEDFDNKEALIYFVVKHNLRPTIQQDVQQWYSNLYCSCWKTDPKDRPSVQTVLELLKTNYKL